MGKDHANMSGGLVARKPIWLRCLCFTRRRPSRGFYVPNRQSRFCGCHSGKRFFRPNRPRGLSYHCRRLQRNFNGFSAFYCRARTITP